MNPFSKLSLYAKRNLLILTGVLFLGGSLEAPFIIEEHVEMVQQQHSTQAQNVTEAAIALSNGLTLKETNPTEATIQIQKAGILISTNADSKLASNYARGIKKLNKGMVDEPLWDSLIIDLEKLSDDLNGFEKKKRVYGNRLKFPK